MDKDASNVVKEALVARYFFVQTQNSTGLVFGLAAAAASSGSVSSESPSGKLSEASKVDFALLPIQLRPFWLDIAEKALRRVVYRFRRSFPATSELPSVDRRSKKPGALGHLLRCSDPRTVFGQSLNLRRERLEISNYITVSRASEPTLLSVRSFGKAWFEAERALPRLPLKSSRERSAALFQLKYRGIQIGDQVAQHALRFDGRAGGSLAHCSSVRSYLRAAIRQINLLCSLELTDQDVFVCSEVFHLNVVYQRFFEHIGAKILVGTKLSPSLSSSEVFRLSADLQPSSRSGSLVESQKRLEMRGSNTSQIRPLDISFAYRLPRFVPPEQRKSASELKNNKLVVLYLHSLDDGQFFCGHDGFSDLLDWTITVLRQVGNNHQGWVPLIKPHPEVNYCRRSFGRSSANFAGLLRLHKALEGQDFFIGDGPLPLQQLCETNKVITVTHHGTVAIESAYQKVPCVYFQGSYFPQQLPLGITWSTPKELENLLKDMDSLSEQVKRFDLRKNAILVESLRFQREQKIIESDPFRILGPRFGSGPDHLSLAVKCASFRPTSEDIHRVLKYDGSLLL